ncbi:MAG: hypothetical protein R3B06_13495 [Kofleriaceae bacterium]
MKPWIELARERPPGSGELSLHQRDRELVIRVDGQELMSTRSAGSEEALATIGCAGHGAGRVLIGGLGLGFTLRAALAALGPAAQVTVAEISPLLVEWNRTVVGPAAAAALADPRVTVHVGDVAAAMPPGAWDAILLDVDNSPHALTRPANAGLYAGPGLARAHAALRPGGRLAVWSAAPYPAFERRLATAGFAVTLHTVRARGTHGGAKHTIFVGDRT